MTTSDDSFQPQIDYDIAPRSSRKLLVQLAVVTGIVYLILSALICAKQAWWAPPSLAADGFIEALQEKDPTGIYLFSDMLGAHLTAMMLKSKMSADARKHMLAKDFNQWKDEFNKGTKAHDTLARERKLVNSQMSFESVPCSDFKAEISDGETRNLVSYKDVPGQAYHLCYRFTYPSAQHAPRVRLLGNIRTARNRRIKSIVIRVEVTRRPEISPPRSWILGWEWLDAIAPAFPLRYLFSNAKPEEVWMARISFQIDKTKIDTY